MLLVLDHTHAHGPLCPGGRINGETCEHGTSCYEIAHASEACLACDWQIGPIALPAGPRPVRTFPRRIRADGWTV
jgi:hypothetical protein